MFSSPLGIIVSLIISISFFMFIINTFILKKPNNKSSKSPLVLAFLAGFFIEVFKVLFKPTKRR